MIQIKRVYAPLELEDGVRYLVDRLWPRGIKKVDLPFDVWLKEVSPSPPLRTWFGHDPARFDAFRMQYRAELDEKPAVWGPILEAARKSNVTLLYAARDPRINHAIILCEYLQEQMRREDGACWRMQ